MPQEANPAESAADSDAAPTQLEVAASEAQTLPDQPGEPGSANQDCAGRIGRYRLMEKLGEGGFGTVWRAAQTDPIQREVALKVVKPGMDSAEIVARFEAERQALALMDHPNIAGVLDAGESENGRPYFVMELVRGVPITAYCDAARLTVHQRVELFVSVCRAVQHAHQKGVLHRDLKPSNILVTEKDGRAIAKVIDFGIAKALGAGVAPQFDAVRPRTLEGMVIGTPQYMSPEQAGARTDVDTRSDIYSLGAVLYELLAGRPPLLPASPRQVLLDDFLRRIREEEIKRPSSCLMPATESTQAIALRRGASCRRIEDTLRGDLDWILLKALEKDRDRRYDSANALADELRRVLNNEPVLAGPPSRRYRFKKFVRRNKGPAAAAAALAIALAGGVLASQIQARRARLAGAQAIAEKNKAASSEAAAQKAKATAEGLINSMIFDLRDKLKPLGRVDLLDDVSRQAENYFASQDAAQLPPEQQRTVFAMHHNRAEVLAAKGDSAQARLALEKALAISEALAKARPADAQAQLDHAFSLGALGSALLAAGDLPSSRAACERSLAILEQHSTKGSKQRDLCMGLDRMANLCEAEGDTPAAARWLERSLDIRRRLWENAPDDATAANDLTVGLGKLGALALTQGNSKLAGELFQEAAALSEKLAADDPANTRRQRSLAIDFGRIGDAALASGNLPAARSAFEKASAVLQRLALGDPANASAQRDFSTSLDRIGEIAEKSGDPAAARTAYQQSLAIDRKIAATDPENRAAQRAVAASLEKIGGLAEDSGDASEAHSRYAESLAIRQRLFDLEPAHPDFQRGLAIALQLCGDAAQSLGEISEARAAHAKCAALYEKLAASDPANAEDQKGLATALTKVGSGAQLAGDFPAARDSHMRALAIRRNLAALHPSNAEMRRSLGVSYQKLGGLAETEADWNSAREYHEKSLEIDREMARLSPQSAAARRDLMLTLNSLAAVAEWQKDIPAARRAAEESLSLCEQLAKLPESGRRAERDLSIALKRMAGLEQLAGNRDAARQLLERCLDMRKRLAAKLDGAAVDPQSERDLSIVYGDLAKLEQAQGKLPAAMRHLQAAGEIARRLGAAAPDNAAAQLDVAILDFQLGTLVDKTSGASNALPHLRKALDGFEKLAASGKLRPALHGLMQELRKIVGNASGDQAD